MRRAKFAAAALFLVVCIGLSERRVAAAGCYIEFWDTCWYNIWYGPIFNGCVEVPYGPSACDEADTFCNNWCQAEFDVNGFAAVCTPYGWGTDYHTGECDCDYMQECPW